MTKAEPKYETRCFYCEHENAPGSKFCSQCASQLKKTAAAQGTSSSSKAPFLMVALFILVPLALVVATCGDGSVEGELRSRGKPHGDFVLKPTSCFSGEHESFFGVWVTPKLKKVSGRQGFQGGLKLLKNNLNEWEAYVESPVECDGLACKIRPLDRTQCKVFQVDVRNTSTSINDIRVREGSARFDCQFAGGGSFNATLKFDGCS